MKNPTQNPAKKIALLGGSFDPPHLAHRQVVEYLLKQKNFEEVWIVPSKQNPLKPAGANFQDRLQMCRLNFEDLGERVKVLSEDQELSGYTIDLVKHLKEKFPHVRFTFVGGSDLESELERWKDPEKLKKLIEFDFLPRPPDPDSPFSPISATDIRNRIKNQLSVEKFLTKGVGEYIQKRKLYL